MRDILLDQKYRKVFHATLVGFFAVFSLILLPHLNAQNYLVTIDVATSTSIPSNCKVYLTGSFNQWSPMTIPMVYKDGKYTTTLSLAQGKYQYKFYVARTDRKDSYIKDQSSLYYYIKDPTNPYMKDDGDGNINSVLLVPPVPIYKPPQDVTVFKYYAPQATNVNLAGDFNNWNQSQYLLAKINNGVWVAWLDLEGPITYRFIVDDTWVTDTANDVKDIPNEYDGVSNSFRWAAHSTSLDPNLDISKYGLTVDLATARQLMKDRKFYLAYPIAQKMSQDITLDPTGESWDILASIYRSYGDLAKSEEMNETLRTKYPNSKYYYPASMRVANHKEYGNPPDIAGAQLIYQNLLEGTSDIKNSIELKLRLAETYSMQTNYSKGIELLLTVVNDTSSLVTSDIEIKSKANEACLLLGILEFQSNNYAKAEEYCNMVIQQSPWPHSKNIETANIMLNRINLAKQKSK